jgi:hypothetical protein
MNAGEGIADLDKELKELDNGETEANPIGDLN